MFYAKRRKHMTKEEHPSTQGHVLKAWFPEWYYWQVVELLEAGDL
jgi:hypothetical protein